jgi:hypothetical protein
MSKLRVIAILLALFWVLAKIGLDLTHIGRTGGVTSAGLVPLFALLGLGAAVMIGLNTAAGGILAAGMLAWVALMMGFDLSLGDGLGGIASALGTGGGLVALLIAGGIVAAIGSGVAAKVWWLAIPAVLLLLPRFHGPNFDISAAGAVTTILVVGGIVLGIFVAATGALADRSDWQQAAHERMRTDLAAQTLADDDRRRRIDGDAG